jgi:DNA-binding NtrC family response regulator
MQTETKLELPVTKFAALNLLIVDDEVTTRNLCNDVALEAGLHVHASATTEQALDILEQYPIDIVVTDLKIPKIGGLELIKRIRTGNPEVSIIVLTQYGTIETAIEATRLGAADYITKPFHVAELRTKLDRLVHSIELDQENRLLREQLRSKPGFGGLIGVSPRMQRVYKLIEKVAQHTYPVLILGESGTGKELVARSIHFTGPRSNKPFSPVDCSSLVPTLIESELFGYVKGAFTGAQHSKQGLFEAAGDGTLFLDEIGDLPVDLQAKLLRALQEREVKPVGSNERVGIRARVIAATNRDLETGYKAGTFRKDLFFRLNVVTVSLPALRERKSDIPTLVQHFLDRYSSEKQSIEITQAALKLLMHYDWPGNVRELENCIERAVALGNGELIDVADLPPGIRSIAPERNVSTASAPYDSDDLEDIERATIQRVFDQVHGDKLLAGKILGISRATLYRKIKRYNIDVAAREPVVVASERA